MRKRASARALREVRRSDITQACFDVFPSYWFSELGDIILDLYSQDRQATKHVMLVTQSIVLDRLHRFS